MKKNTTILFLFQWLLFTLTAQIPAGYYSSADGKSNKELKTSLHSIIKVGTRLGYGSGNGKTWSGFEKVDKRPNGYVWDMYSTNYTISFPGNGGVPSGMNIEHSVAKSWWGGSNNDAYKDLYHLNPSNTAANSSILLCALSRLMNIRVTLQGPIFICLLVMKTLPGLEQVHLQ